MTGTHPEIPNDDDRIYLLDPTRIVKIDDDRTTKFEILPTDDPDKYVVRISEPAPRFYIKTAQIAG